MSCYIMICYVMLCYVMLYYDILYHVILFFVMSYNIMSIYTDIKYKFNLNHVLNCILIIAWSNHVSLCYTI